MKKGALPVEQEVYLQTILGTDRKNPLITLCRYSSAAEEIYVFFGAELLEVVPEDKNNPQFKLLIAGLYNAGIKAKTLTEEFGIARTTMKRWGDALQANDPERLLRVLAGPGSPRKLTPEVVAFVEMRFADIYWQTHYNYSARIRDEIEQVFGYSLSGETLRPLFNRLKQDFSRKADTQAAQTDNPNRSSKCDLTVEAEQGSSEKEIHKIACNNVKSEDQQEEGQEIQKDNRKHSLVFYQKNQGSVFCHHAGVLIFASLLTSLHAGLAPAAKIIKQWVVAVLLGAVNVEQTKLLNTNALDAMLGKHIRSLNLQREQLDELATDQTLKTLFEFNAEMVQAKSHTDFYYDPHTKHYTGAAKILKGWCPKVRGVAKALHMDFIHTTTGEPVFVEHADNFYDLRERFPKIIGRFREMMGRRDETDLTFILDRGIFKIELFTAARDAHNHIITWEKGYKRGQWDEDQASGSFVILRPRNSSKDLQTYHFHFMDRAWQKNPSLRQIIVLATNPKGKTIEVSILATDPRRSAEHIIRLMFKRWLQENDYKYLDNHFGINEITSYAVLSYRKLAAVMEDKQIQSGQIKVLQLRKDELHARLSKVLLQKHLDTKANSTRDNTIKQLTLELKEVKAQMAQSEKEVSRLQTLIDQRYCQLDTRRKSLMDAVKIIARNIFYEALQPFREMYDNYRDDHVIFRNLTRAHGLLVFGPDKVSVTLYPTMQYPPRLHRLVATSLQAINQAQFPMPDGSTRTIHFALSQKTSKLFAIDDKEKQAIY
jgi:hypothetical protein